MPPPLRCCAAAAAALLLLLLLLLPPPAATTLASSACCVGRPRSVSASCWGWTAADSTESLQAAIDCGASEVRVPKMRGPWVVSTTATRRSPAAVGSRGTHAAALYLRSNQRVVLEEGVVVLAKRGSFHGLQDSLIMGTGISNASIVGLGANGATLRMWKMDYANASLYQQGTCSARGACRMGIELTNVSDVLLSGLTIQSTGGDGIFARGVTNGTFSGLVLDNNFRQGVSVSSGVNLLFEDCRFINTGRRARW
jgi:polygalacturonase